MPKKIGKPQYRAARRPHPGRTTGTTVSSPCCVGIDIGSHRSRLCLSANGSEIIVENKHQHNLDNSYPGDFPSSLYVFDDDDNDSAGNDRSAHAGVLYSVERDYPERLSVSAKYVFYALADASDTLLLQYPLVRDIVDRKHDPKFKARLRNAMVALLSVLRERAMPIILNKNWHIAKVGLTIPVQWTLEFEDVYRDLVSEVFEVNPNIIYFFTETEALARYLFKHHASEMDPNEEYNAIMFIDFGGHNMNGCVFGVARDPENPECNSFYRVGRAFGAGGGAEQWEHHVAQWFSAAWFGQFRSAAPPQYREKLLSEFRLQKGREANLRTPVVLAGMRPETGSTWRLSMKLEDIENTWHMALERPLETVRRELRCLARMVQSGYVTKPLVVVSGGTARNPAVKSRMAALCQKHNVPLAFTDDFYVGISYNSAKVAKAAAYVVGETLTVEQFFQRGAAIGIQMKQSPEQGKPTKAPIPWDDSGALLLNLRGRPTVELPAVRYKDEFQLVCDPFFERLPDDERKRVAAKLSYDLIYLGKRRQGGWRFRLSLEGSGDDMWLTLQQEHRQRRDMPWEIKKTLRLPLYFDGNSGCVQVGERNKTIQELNLGLPPQPNELGEVEEGASTDESDQEVDSECGSILVRDPTASSPEPDTSSESSGEENDGSFAECSTGHPRLGGSAAEIDGLPKVQQENEIWEFRGLPSLPRAVSDLVPPDRKRHRSEPYQQSWKRRRATKDCAS